MGRTAIIGAGVTGLVCADALRGDVTVFEKSRGIGGRLSTRMVEVEGTEGQVHAIAFDHGTPAIRPRDALFAGLLSDLADAGTAREWRNGLIVGEPTMRGLLAPLAEGLDLRFGSRVDALERGADGWTVVFEPHEREGGTRTGREGPFSRVVLAIPAHQARTLLQSVAPVLADRLAGIRMKPCWTLMAAFEGAPRPIASRKPVEGVHWLVCEGDKPGRNRDVRAWTLQMSGEWSAERLEMERDEITPLLMTALRARTGETDEPIITMAHRWRYSHTAVPLGEPYLEEHGLYVGGDWTSGACAEDGWASGKAMAAALV